MQSPQNLELQKIQKTKRNYFGKYMKKVEKETHTYTKQHTFITR